MTDEKIGGSGVAALRSRFDSLSLRERALVTVSALAVIWMAWDWTLGAEAGRRAATLESRVAALQQSLVAEARKEATLRGALADDPDVALRAELETIGRDIEILDARLEADLGRFVPPTHMPAMLEDVVRRHAGVVLERVQSLPPQAVDVGAGADTRLYRHTLRVEVSGTYFDVLAYLTDLEASKWRFAWRTLDYRVEEHPRARVAVEIETLSHDPNVLGV